jgi:hypothetical protein
MASVVNILSSGGEIGGGMPNFDVDIKPLNLGLGLDLGIKPLSLEIKPLEAKIITESTVKADTTSKLDLNARTNNVLDTNSALKVDLQPFQGDLCLKLKLGLDHLPSTSVCRDANRHFGITLFGIKVIGFDYGSSSNTLVEDLGQRPFVVGQRPDHHHPGFGANGIRISVAE